MKVQPVFGHFKTKLSRFLLYVSVIILFQLAVITSFAQAATPDTAPVIIDSGWEYRWEDSPRNDSGEFSWLSEDMNSPGWIKYGFPGKPQNPQKFRNIWVRVKLPEGNWQHANLLFRAPQQSLEVYLKDKLIYQFGNMDFSNTKVTPGSIWHFIDLPEGYGGEILTFRLYSPFCDYAGYLVETQIGSKSDLVISTVKNEIDYVILAGLFIVIGLIVLLFRFLVRIELSGIIPLGFMSICIGIWIIAESKFLQLFFYQPVLPIYIANAAIFLAPVGFCSFVENVFDLKNKIVLRRLWQIWIIITIILFALDLARVESILITVSALHIFMVLIMAITIVLIGQEALKGSKDARIFLVGLTILFSCGVHDIIIMFYSTHHQTKLITHYGMFAFVLSLIFIHGNQYKEINKKLKEFSEENEVKYRTLVETVHEGIGILDLQKKIVYCNPRFSEIFGLSQKELLGKSIFDFNQGEINRLPQEKDTSSGNDKHAVYEITIVSRMDEKKILSVSESQIPDVHSDYKGSIIAVFDITERKKAEETIRHQAYTDSITNLYNRTYFETEMARLGKDMSRYSNLGIISIDIDGLKIVNDTFGHNAGDILLQKASGIIAKVFRSSDIVARVGGDEFCILLYNAGKKTIEEKKNKILEHIKEYNANNPVIPLSMSIGTAFLTKDDATIYDIYKRADDSMYQYKLSQSGSLKSKVIDMLLAALSERDYVAQGHIERLVAMAECMADRLQITDIEKRNLILLAKVHDLGKIGIPDEILFKPGKLTVEEYEKMKEHVKIGYDIANRSRELSNIATLILYHHEFWNGKGYLHGLKGIEIPIECRILSIIDAYDAMTSKRPYSNGISKEEAIREIDSCAGTQFDPILARQFVQLLKEKEFNMLLNHLESSYPGASC